MKLFLFIFAASVYFTHGIRLDGYRVTHAWSGALRDKECFFDIPKSVKEAESSGYTQVINPPDYVTDITMMCFNGDPRVCPLYDKSGTIAGMQLAIPVKDLDGLPYDVSRKMRMKTISGGDYWTTAYYIVSPETIKAGGRKGLTETIEGLWIPNQNQLMSIPTNEADLASKTGYKKQNCIPNMGTHYYYNMSKEMNCQDFFPYFVLVKEGRVIGLGFTIIGKTENGERPWFEHVGSPGRAIEITIPSAPECLKPLSNENGVTNLHMYFIEEPWNIKCEDSDSFEPLSIVNKVILNTSRYAGKVVDEAKNVFSG